MILRELTFGDDTDLKEVFTKILVQTTLGNDKLKLLDFAVHGTIDDYSRKIFRLTVLRSNNSSSIIGDNYLDCMKEFQLCPIKLITDLEPENVLAATLQTYFRQDVIMHITVCPQQEIKG